MKELPKFAEAWPRTVLLLAAGLCFGATALAADYVVIVNKANDNKVDKAMIGKIYIGETKAWVDGTPVVAVDLPEDNALRANFGTDLTGKTISNLKALWAQMIFSGKAMPPKVAATDDDVKKLVIANKGGIGYVKSSSADDTVRVVLK